MHIGLSLSLGRNQRGGSPLPEGAFSVRGGIGVISVAGFPGSFVSGFSATGGAGGVSVIGYPGDLQIGGGFNVTGGTGTVSVAGLPGAFSAGFSVTGGTGAVSAVGYAGTLTITPESPNVTLNGDGTASIVVDSEDGTFSVILSGSSTAHHNGTFGPFDPDDFDTGPILVVAGVITGTAGTGETLTALPGLWIYPDDDVPTVARIWQRDDADRSGETGTTYVTVVGDEGSTIECQETATNGAGARSSDSNGIAIPVSGDWAITGSDNTLTVTDQPTAPATPTISGGELTLTVTG